MWIVMLGLTALFVVSWFFVLWIGLRLVSNWTRLRKIHLMLATSARYANKMERAVAAQDWDAALRWGLRVEELHEKISKDIDIGITKLNSPKFFNLK